MFYNKSNPTENLDCHTSFTHYHIDANLSTCHHSTAVVLSAKFCSNRALELWMRVNWIFHQFRITIGKSSVKWARWSTLLGFLAIGQWNDCWCANERTRRDARIQIQIHKPLFSITHCRHRHNTIACVTKSLLYNTAPYGRFHIMGSTEQSIMRFEPMMSMIWYESL